MSAQEVNEIANVPSGFTLSPSTSAPRSTESGKEIEEKPVDERTEAEKAVSNVPGLTRSVQELENDIEGTRRSVAEIRKDGKVKFDEVSRTN